MPTHIASKQSLEACVRAIEPDVLVLAADTPAASLEDWVDEVCFATGVPFVMAGQWLPAAQRPHRFMMSTASDDCAVPAGRPGNLS